MAVERRGWRWGGERIRVVGKMQYENESAGVGEGGQWRCGERTRGQRWGEEGRGEGGTGNRERGSVWLREVGCLGKVEDGLDGDGCVGGEVQREARIVEALHRGSGQSFYHPRVLYSVYEGTRHHQNSEEEEREGGKE